jgi:hypothetical protein
MVVRDTNDKRVRDCLEDIRTKARRDPGARLHWADLKHFHRRYAAQELAKLPIRLIYVLVPKLTIPRGSRLASEHGAFYNFAARLVVERISWHVEEQHGIAKLTFERVKGYPEHVLLDYLRLLRERAPGDTSIHVTWDAIHPTVRVDSPANVKNLTAADLAAGALDSAVRPDLDTGLRETSYLFSLAPTVMRYGYPRRHLRYGLKALAPSPNQDAPFTSLPWWPGPFK